MLTLSLAFGDDPAADGTVVAALVFAARQLGTPYLWGGTRVRWIRLLGAGPGRLRRCRRLAPPGGPGPVLGRSRNWPTGPRCSRGIVVFFGAGPTAVDHVGIYVGSGLMIDAPHTGALVRVESAGWSGLVGATRPA